MHASELRHANTAFEFWLRRQYPDANGTFCNVTPVDSHFREVMVSPFEPELVKVLMPSSSSAHLAHSACAPSYRLPFESDMLMRFG